MAPNKDKFEKAGKIFQQHGGTMRTAQAMHRPAGFHPMLFFFANNSVFV
jgi:hypothetical protein